MLKELRYIFNHKEKVKLLGLLVMMGIGSGLELMAVAIFSPFINILMNPDYVYDNYWLNYIYQKNKFPSMEYYLAFIALAICAIYLIKNVYLCVLQNTILSFSYKTRMGLATRLLATYMREPYVFHLSKNIAEMQRSLQTDTTQFMNLVNSVLQVAVEIFVCIALGIFLFKTSNSITVVVGVLLLGCVGLFYMVSKKVSLRVGRQNEEYNAKLFQWINQALGGIKEVKVLEREDFFIDSYKSNYKKLIKGAKLNELLAAVPKYIVETVCIAGMLIAVVIKLLFGRKEIYEFIPQLSVFAVAAFRLLPSVGKINAYINNIMYNIPSLDMIYNDLKEIENVQLIEEPRVENDGKDWNFEDKIEVRGVTYHYPDSEIKVLENVNLVIPKGKMVAFIGASGAGKTTLADIVLGLLRPTDGTVYMDKFDIYSNMRKWHKKIGYIPQSIYLSDDTIRNNIAFGIKDSQIDESAVWRALEMAQLKDFVAGLEKGLDTWVGDRGVRLSGGQRQRIGIARALYHDPEILVLDEATSALDNDTEKAVMDSIDKLQGVKTMIIIAHRLTTIKNADIIYEVSEGNVREVGKEKVFPT